LGQPHTHDVQTIVCHGRMPKEVLHAFSKIDLGKYFANADEAMNPEKRQIIVLPVCARPYSTGRVTLRDTDPTSKPVIDYGLLGDPRDVDIMAAAVQHAIELAATMGLPVSSLHVPHNLATKHNHQAGSTPTAELVRDWILHYGTNVQHPTSTCRIGHVVDSSLKVKGVTSLRVADASVMPTVTSGNTHAPSVMIGEKCAAMIAGEHKIRLADREEPYCCQIL